MHEMGLHKARWVLAIGLAKQAQDNFTLFPKKKKKKNCMNLYITHLFRF